MSDDAMLDAYHAYRVDYSPRDGVDTEPESLADFSDLVAGDHQEFQETREAVEHIHFTNLLTRESFAGGGGSLPEAVDYAQAYHELEIGMRILMMQLEGGLQALQLGAGFIHMAYELSDLFGAEQVGNPFAGYDTDTVREVFSGGNVGIEQIANDGGGGEETQHIEDEWESHLENVDQIENLAEMDAQASNAWWDGGQGDGASVHGSTWPDDRVQHAEFQHQGDDLQLTLPYVVERPAPAPHPVEREVEQ